MVQQEKSIVTEQNLKKRAKGQCTLGHKRIMDFPLASHYTLVKSIVFPISARPELLHICKNIHITFSFLHGYIVSSFSS